MDPEDIDLAREELEARLQAMTGLTDMPAFQRELHSLKGIAMAYGLRGFAEAAHLIEDRIAEGRASAMLGGLLESLGRELDRPAAQAM
jgi:HPt (histidine-containing phosphotransfer) domain-containing protein|tara:strand:+ start:82571 stop:82834 length:264 start_codon:yes stop_codon:yes gene_type:complete